MLTQPNLNVAVPVVVANVVAPAYPECLYGSRRYTVDSRYSWTCEGETIETLASRTFNDRDTALIYADSLVARVGAGSTTCVD